MNELNTEIYDKLSNDIDSLVQNALVKIAKTENTVELEFNLSFTERVCEQCGSTDVKDSTYEDDDDPNKTDVGINCNSCGAFTTFRTEVTG